MLGVPTLEGRNRLSCSLLLTYTVTLSHMVSLPQLNYQAVRRQFAHKSRAVAKLMSPWSRVQHILR
jgi:hypothetical protein